MSLDIKILDIYGMSETSGPHTLVTNESLAGKMAADKKCGYSSCGKILCDSFKSKLVSPGNEGLTAEKKLVGADLAEIEGETLETA